MQRAEHTHSCCFSLNRQRPCNNVLCCLERTAVWFYGVSIILVHSLLKKWAWIQLSNWTHKHGPQRKLCWWQISMLAAGIPLEQPCQAVLREAQMQGPLQRQSLVRHWNLSCHPLAASSETSSWMSLFTALMLSPGSRWCSHQFVALVKSSFTVEKLSVVCRSCTSPEFSAVFAAFGIEAAEICTVEVLLNNFLGYEMRPALRSLLQWLSLICLQLLVLLQRLRLEQLYLPLLLPNFRVASLQLGPVFTEKDELAVENVTQLINFLTGGSGMLSLRSMTPSLAKEVILPSFTCFTVLLSWRQAQQMYDRTQLNVVKKAYPQLPPETLLILTGGKLS